MMQEASAFAGLAQPRPKGPLARASRHVMRAELSLSALLVGAILLLLLANVISRAVGRPLIWTDELAVHLMVLTAFLGASIGIAARNHMAIDLLPGRFGPRGRARLALAADLLVLVFLVVMALLLWRWLDPAGLIRAGSGAGLAQASFNFVYTDPTMTLGIRKIWFWLILPVTCATGILHALAAIAADLAVLADLR